MDVSPSCQSAHDAEIIFKKFWELGDYEMQNVYLQRMVIVQPIKRKRTNKQAILNSSIQRAVFPTDTGSSVKVTRARCDTARQLVSLGELGSSMNRHSESTGTVSRLALSSI
ncbi:hypothetical protein E2C01_081035 [Portunus trituberculatus]|uniref:Uncharacterized protein n=1 Tax=Portunus trituberculatus TaxID=210409 RepID=A0A5B7IUR3_PORTR|nr:hypothetical protein [Portunus trituberculatus]